MGGGGTDQVNVVDEFFELHAGRGGTAWGWGGRGRRRGRPSLRWPWVQELFFSLGFVLDIVINHLCGMAKCVCEQ